MSIAGLAFARVEITKVGQVFRRAMRVLPLSDGSQQQRIAIGDGSGSVSLLGLHKGDLEQRFRTLPLCGATSEAVSRIELYKDRIFTAIGHIIVGLSRKGKEFFRLETGLTERISSLQVEGEHLFVGGEYSFYHFLKDDDVGYFLCPDRINDLLCCKITSDSEYDVILACQDKLLRVLQGTEVLFQIPVDGAATSIHRYDPESVRTRALDRVLIYGTSNGAIGCVTINTSGFSHKWKVVPESPNSSSIVNCITSGDWMGDGCRDIAVGRDDGSIEVYQFVDRSTSTGYENNVAPVLKFQAKLPESVQAIDHGQVISPKFEDIIVATFSGRIVAFSPDTSGTIPTTQSTSTSSSTVATEKERNDHDYLTGEEETKRRIRIAENQVQELEAKLQEQKQKAEAITAASLNAKRKSMTSTTTTTDQQKPTSKIDLPPAPQVNARMTLMAKEICHRLVIESELPIEFVCVQCDVPIGIEEVDRETCSLSFSTTSSPSDILATVKTTTSNVQRVELKVRVNEGQYGTLNAFVAPMSSAPGIPRGMKLCSISIKPLSMHERLTTQLTKEEQARPMSEVSVTGSFTMSEFHAWLCLCFPEIPERLSSDVEALFNFKSVHTGSLIQCDYKKGNARFRSDSLPVLAIVKDFIAKTATERQAKVSMKTAINESCIQHLVMLVNSKCEIQFKEQQKFLLVEPLKELLVHEQDALSFLSPELQDVCRHSDQIQSSHSENQHRLELLFGVLVSLFRSRLQLQGIPASPSKEAELRSLLSQYNLEKILNFFQSQK